MAFCKLLSMLVLIHNTGGLLGAEVSSSIIGGQDAAEGRWPWMVHINVTSKSGARWRCGGTILNSEWVLTSANCWDTAREPVLRRSMIFIGAHSLHKAAERYLGILYVIPHPEYRAVGKRYVNDIALVKMKKKLTFSEEVRPVTLPSEGDTFNGASECWLTGWGDIGNNTPLPAPETLQELKILIVPQSMCKLKYPEVTPDMLCAGDVGRDACKGDSGDPLMCRAAGGYMQVGIMSYGSPDGCALPGRPSVFTHVSKYLHFINAYIHHA
ncbi:tryptase-2-like isoform X2 [Toxotes jaculatrix]|uniref:tryptase-2-like isoform X2 n=1 Tax=Toxotes jaculatrix TaxID=941984 RepID=UPI001B3AC3EB|nr:tryptase-2-like isoform X2 [Toxotes jaculatrix]